MSQRGNLFQVASKNVLSCTVTVFWEEGGSIFWLGDVFQTWVDLQPGHAHSVYGTNLRDPAGGGGMA